MSALRKAAFIAACAVAGAAVGCASVAPAQGMPEQRICEEYHKTKELLRGVGRVPIGYGLAGAAGVVEIYVGKDGTWTAININPYGVACLLALGSDWTFVETPWPAEGIDG